MAKLKGIAHVYGDDIDTDRIIPGKYTKTIDISDLAAHVLEDLDPAFRENVNPGDVLVGGKNFGAGSSREQAAIAIKAIGIAAVVAESFARIFYRNAVNIGLPVLEIGPHSIKSGNAITIDLKQGQVVDTNSSKTYAASQTPDVMVAILNQGGLVNYLKLHGTYRF